MTRPTPWRPGCGPALMAIVNATPDSFADGGRWTDVGQVVQQARRWMAEGVDLLDVGGESTRPGSQPVDPQQEWSRVEPLLQGLSELGPELALSIDTRHASVARNAIELGAVMVNDVSGLQEDEMLEVIASTGVSVVVGHLRGEPATMQSNIAFQDVVREVGQELQTNVERLIARGVQRRAIWVDPGLGFGKTTEQCMALLVAGQELRERTGCEVVMGASRKRFLGEITGRPVQDRAAASVAAAMLAVQHGAAMVRVHDVSMTRDALHLWRRAQRA